MIQPAIFDSRELLKAELIPGQAIFAITGASSYYYASVGLFCHNTVNEKGWLFVVWRDQINDLRFTTQHRSALSSAKFMEYLFDKHPDHFEWFLFHPEWLK